MAYTLKGEPLVNDVDRGATLEAALEVLLSILNDGKVRQQHYDDAMRLGVWPNEE